MSAIEKRPGGRRLSAWDEAKAQVTAAKMDGFHEATKVRSALDALKLGMAVRRQVNEERRGSGRS